MCLATKDVCRWLAGNIKMSKIRQTSLNSGESKWQICSGADANRHNTAGDNLIILVLFW